MFDALRLVAATITAAGSGIFFYVAIGIAVGKFTNSEGEK